MTIIRYIKARLAERSTWASVVIAITGGAALSEPYSFYAIGAGIVGALVPTSGAE
jgi:hypothetical protein